MTKKLKISALSDIHGLTGIDIEPCDILFICGDIVPTTIEKDEAACAGWFDTMFIPWIDRLPCDKAIVIAGNHDFYMNNREHELREMFKKCDKLVYLNCDIYEYEGVVIYGTPLCKRFGPYAFMGPIEGQDELYNRMLNVVDKIDIIVAHDAPYGCSDILLQRGYDNERHIGNKALKRLVEKAQPKLMLHGHLHSTNHDKETIGDTDVYCVSITDEGYFNAYKPLYLEMEFEV